MSYKVEYSTVISNENEQHKFNVFIKPDGDVYCNSYCTIQFEGTTDEVLKQIKSLNVVDVYQRVISIIQNKLKKP